MANYLVAASVDCVQHLALAVTEGSELARHVQAMAMIEVSFPCLAVFPIAVFFLTVLE